MKVLFQYLVKENKHSLPIPTSTLYTLVKNSVYISRMINLERSEMFEDDQQNIWMRKL
jgi:hypothetical protein